MWGGILSCRENPNDSADNTEPPNPLTFSFIDSAFPTDTGLYWGETGILQPSLTNGEVVDSDGWNYKSVTRDGTPIYVGTDTTYVSLDTSGDYAGYLRIKFTIEDDKYNNYVDGEYLAGSTEYKVEVSGTSTEGTEYSNTFTYELSNVGLEFVVISYDEESKGYELGFRFITSFEGMFTEAVLNSIDLWLLILARDRSLHSAQIGQFDVFTTGAPSATSPDTDDVYRRIVKIDGSSLYATSFRISYTVNSESNPEKSHIYYITIKDDARTGALVGQSFVLPIDKLLPSLATLATIDYTIDARGVSAKKRE